jgi:hypothetical protein
MTVRHQQPVKPIRDPPWVLMVTVGMAGAGLPGVTMGMGVRAVPMVVAVLRSSRPMIAVLIATLAVASVGAGHQESL